MLDCPYSFTEYNKQQYLIKLYIFAQWLALIAKFDVIIGQVPLTIQTTRKIIGLISMGRF